jgi:hypothetical protein
VSISIIYDANKTPARNEQKRQLKIGIMWFVVWVGSKCQAKAEMAASDRHTSLLHFRQNCSIKIFHSDGRESVIRAAWQHLYWLKASACSSLKNYLLRNTTTYTWDWICHLVGD